MALRAFRSNPSLGGFGGESRFAVAVDSLNSNDGAIEKDCDAFGQIVKELVDNAVDACSTADSNSDDEPKRVRVIIRELKEDDDAAFQGKDQRTASDQILRVTVIDNGCGMENVEECVGVFRSTKADNASQADGDNAINTQEKQTAGRYGIGLTLCLLHAQRLVPNSYASITSATPSASEFTRASYVVDVDGDSIRCDKIEMIPKKSSDERGTAVSVLIPGGQTALQAWPRLAEYFARFQLSLGLTCSLEVLAPSLSSVPLFIRPSAERVSETSIPDEHFTPDAIDESFEPQRRFPQELEDQDFWNDGLLEEEQSFNGPPAEDKRNDARTALENEDRSTGSKKEYNKPGTNRDDASLARRQALVPAATSYLKQPVLLKNVAHSIQPIRLRGTGNVKEKPQLEVDMIIYNSPTDCTSEPDDEDDIVSNLICDFPTENRNANLMLVRMVNQVPLLDGAEASACGLVRGLCWKQSTWNAFGLHVTPSDERTISSSVNNHGNSSTSSMLKQLFAPTFAVRDSDQVAPFFEKASHSQLETDYDDDCSRASQDEDDVDDWHDLILGQKRKKSHKHRKLLPAHVRLGNILVIAQIHAKPSTLPLPTLSKGRLPMNEQSIDDALELGILGCLRSLQTTNPSLLLTAQQLKQTERDARYIPSTAAAIASIACKSTNQTFRNSFARSILSWKNDDQESPSSFVDGEPAQSQSSESILSRESGDEASFSMEELFRLETVGPALEERLRKICSTDGRKKHHGQQKSAKKRSSDESNDDNSERIAGLEALLEIESESEHSGKNSEEQGGRVLEEWEDPFNDDDSW